MGKGFIDEQTAAAVSGAIVTIAVAVSLFFLPVWIGDVISYDQWRWRMWFSSWI